MSVPQRWFWRVSATALALTLATMSVTRPLPGQPPSSTPSASPTAAAVPPQVAAVVGTASCSARGCHGKIEAGEAASSAQNEFLASMHDRHGLAYQVLLNPESKRIIANLGEKRPAHQNPRCLACHINPGLAHLPPGDPVLEKEKLFGVGCESCHGPAGNWLVAHSSWTAAERPRKKQDYRMILVNDAWQRATMCAGCHIGAPSDASQGYLSSRDVNHDLIAAGHPRLLFEMNAFQTNMPPHWRTSSCSPAELWMEGQLASAAAALKLLVYRAEVGDRQKVAETPPWPEFAEYDCYACHHGLAEQSWRNPRAGRRAGTLPWGSWHFALLRRWPGQPLPLEKLEKTMQEPSPSRDLAVTQARTLLATLESFRKHTEPAAEQLAALAKQNDVEITGWDDAEQVFLALHALNQIQPDGTRTSLLERLEKLRAFPPDFSGPVSRHPTQHVPFQPGDFMKLLWGKSN